MKNLIQNDTIHIQKLVLEECCSPFAVPNKVHLSRLNINRSERTISL